MPSRRTSPLLLPATFQDHLVHVANAFTVSARSSNGRIVFLRFPVLMPSFLKILIIDEQRYRAYSLGPKSIPGLNPAVAFVTHTPFDTNPAALTRWKSPPAAFTNFGSATVL